MTRYVSPTWPAVDRSALIPTARQVKGSDWLGDQDAIHYMTREAPNTVLEVSSLSFEEASRVTCNLTIYI